MSSTVLGAEKAKEIIFISDEVTEFSDLFSNKGTKKYYRAYVEIKKSNVKEEQ